MFDLYWRRLSLLAGETGVELWSTASLGGFARRQVFLRGILRRGALARRAFVALDVLRALALVALAFFALVFLFLPGQPCCILA